jgi:hypothetical protein
MSTPERRTKTQNRNNRRSLPENIDKVLLRHLSSPQSYLGITHLLSTRQIIADDSTPKQKLKDRLSYLRKLQITDPDPIHSSIQAKQTKNMEEKMRNLSLSSSKEEEHRIIVNLTHPEKNEGILVYPVRDIPGIDNNSYYEGFYVMLRYDPEWVMEDETKPILEATLKEKNEIQINIPQGSYEALRRPKHFKGKVPDRVHTAMEHRKVSKMKAQKDGAAKSYTSVILDFGEDVELSSKLIFKDAGDEEALDPSYFSVPTECKDLGHTADEWWACWEVARSDLAPLLQGDIVDKTNASKASAKMKQYKTAATNGMSN